MISEKGLNIVKESVFIFSINVPNAMKLFMLIFFLELSKMNKVEKIVGRVSLSLG